MRNLFYTMVVAMLAVASFYSHGTTSARLKPMGAGFNAPTLNDKTNVYDPKLGEIIYDSSDNVFYGRAMIPGTPPTFFWAPMSGAATSSNPVGTVITFAGATCPSGYVAADGKSYLQGGTYAALYGVITIAHGDGTTGSIGEPGCPGPGCFNVPDYRGRFLRGVNGSASNDPDTSTRTAMATGGNTGNGVGSLQSQATKKNGLSLTDPGHNHQVYPTSYGGTLTTSVTRYVGDGNGGPNLGAVISASSLTGIAMGNGDNETRPVNAYVNYCIKY